MFYVKKLYFHCTREKNYGLRYLGTYLYKRNWRFLEGFIWIKRHTSWSTHTLNPNRYYNRVLYIDQPLILLFIFYYYLINIIDVYCCLVIIGHRKSFSLYSISNSILKTSTKAIHKNISQSFNKVKMCL